jgi:hypothetical protein
VTFELLGSPEGISLRTLGFPATSSVVGSPKTCWQIGNEDGDAEEVALSDDDLVAALGKTTG